MEDHHFTVPPPSSGVSTSFGYDLLPTVKAIPAPTLRDYQLECVTAIRQAFTRWRRVLHVLPTGGGKTVEFSYITAHAAAKGNRVIVLAHRQEIADQISIALAAMDVAHGRIQPGYAMTNNLAQVAMVQTVHGRLAVIPEPALVVIDEAHHAVASTWSKIAAAWPNAKVLGVTATPERLDGVGLRDAFDTMVVGPDVRELIDASYLAPFKYLAPSTLVDLSHVRSIGGDYNTGDLAQAVDQDGITGDVVEHYLKHLAGRTAIAFTVTIAHAQHVAQRFQDAGISAESIDGTMSADERRDVVNRLRTGDIRVLTSCEIISEGFDAPAVGGAILLRPTQSFALFRQQVGRCLRPKDDGSAAIIADHVGNVFRHGLPDAPHEWSLDSKKRAQADRQQAAAGWRRCQACSEVFATGTDRDVCPTPDADECLFRPRVLPEREGVLEEIVSPPWAHGIDIHSARGWQWYQLLQHADGDPTRLRQIQVARGYKAGWTRYAVQEAAEKRAATQRGAAA
jgi:superfamily II DNA or RNA helicase